MKKSMIFMLLAILSILLKLAGELTGTYILKLLFEPLTILFLIFYYVFSVGIVKRLFVFGLIFLFIGEIVFLSGGDLSFVLGLCTNLITHILYTIVIWRMIRGRKFKFLQVLVSFCFFFSFLGIFLWLTYDHLGDFSLPVIFYGVTLCIMGGVAALNYLCRINVSSLILLGGIATLVVSALATGFDKFYIRYEYFEAFNVVTFALSQVMITQAMVLISKD